MTKIRQIQKIIKPKKGIDDRIVYVIKCLDYYKIGYAANVNSRLSQLQTGNPFDLRLILSIESENAEKLEKEIHKRFNDYKLRGEWFSLNNDLIMDLCWEYDVRPLVSLSELNSDEEKKESLSEIKKVQDSYNSHLKKSYVVEEKLSLLVKYWNDKIDPFNKVLSEAGVNSIKKILKRYSFEEVIDAMDGAESTYIDYDDKSTSSIALDKIEAVARTKKKQKENPNLKELMYIRGILKNRFGSFVLGYAIPLMNESLECGYDIEEIKRLAKTADNWTDFQYEIS